MVSSFSYKIYKGMHTSSYILCPCIFLRNYITYICNVLHEMFYANSNTKNQQTPRARWTERPQPKPSEIKTKSQKPWAVSQVKPCEATWSQSQKPKTKSQKSKTKWARKWEILVPKRVQNTDLSTKMQQIAMKVSPS